MQLKLYRPVHKIMGRSTKAVSVIFGFVTLVILILLYLPTENPYDVHNVNGISVLKPTVTDFQERYTGVWSPYMDVLLEEEALTGPQISDRKQAFKTLTVRFRGEKRKYKVGDIIFLDLNAYDYYDDHRPFGGDNIRVRMAESALDAASSGYIIDHGNGSYTGVLKALWEGTPTVFVQMVYTREEIVYLYELHRKFRTKFRSFQAIYKDNIMEETGDCSPLLEELDTETGICNLTDRNDGIPWYCQKPVTHGLMCENLTNLQHIKVDERIILSNLQSKLWLNEERNEIPRQISVKGNQERSLKKQRYPSCPKYDRRKLWQQRSPVGYFYNGTWLLSHCKAAPKTDFAGCLRRKTLILYGASTVGQWYRELVYRFACMPFDPVYLSQGCFNRDLNLTIYRVEHNLPGHVSMINQRWSLEEQLDFVVEGTRPVFLLHIYAHYVSLHHTLYRERLQKLRKSIESMLNKRPDALIFFKGPHMFLSKFRVVSDYYAYVYRPIIMEEFQGLHDKIIYLDYMDMTIAKAEKKLHPGPIFVNYMLDEMIAYIC